MAIVKMRAGKQALWSHISDVSKAGSWNIALWTWLSETSLSWLALGAVGSGFNTHRHGP